MNVHTCQQCKNHYFGDFCPSCPSKAREERLAAALANPPGPRHAVPALPRYRCKTTKPDGSIVDGCGWEGPATLKCPSCGSATLRMVPVEVRGFAASEQAGRKFDGGKPPWHLLAWDAIKLVVLVLAFGAKKYADRNWEQGIAHSRTFAAAQRHMHSWFQEREDNDPETGLHHLAHAICELMFALAFDVRKMHHVTVKLPLENGTTIEVELDNRPGKLVA